MIPTWRAMATGLVCGVCLLPGPALAQSNERIYEDLDFRFVTPGARAVAMGKTFIGLADDATAAVSNPAGLSNLLDQEFSFEFTATDIEHQRFVPGVQDQVRSFGQTVLTPSFFSYVLPMRRATMAVFLNTLQDYRETYELPERFIPDLNDFEDGSYGTLSVEVQSFGASGAFVVTPYLSVGGSVTMLSLDLASQARSGTRFAPRNGTDTIGSDLAWTGIGGLLLKPTRDLSVGFTYNRGAVFDLETRLFGDFLYTLPTTPPIRVDVNLTGELRETNYVVPDRYSAGLSWQLHNRFTVLADVSRVNYSQQVTDKFLIADFQDPAAGLTPDNYYIDDVYEAHAGAEWRRYGQRWTWSLRGGVFTDPDHRLRFRSGGNNLDHPADPISNFRFNSGRATTDVGYTVGGGVNAFNRIQVDGAVSLSPDANQVVVSTVIRLP